MGDFDAVQPRVVSFGDYQIECIRYQSVTNSDLVVAIVVIDPPTIDTAPDITLGFGRTELEAYAEAMITAKEQIRKNQP